MSVLTQEEVENAVRHDWTKDEIANIYHRPLLELVFEASQVHKQYHKIGEVQATSSTLSYGCQSP